MRTPLRWAALAAVLAAMGGCKPAAPAAVQPVGDEVLNKADLQYYWQWQVLLEPGEQLQRVWLLDENLYFLTDRNRLIALDAAVGHTRWTLPVAPVQKRVFAPQHPITSVSLTEKVAGMKEILNDRDYGKVETFRAVAINTIGNALLIDRATGKVYRDVPFDFTANTPTACDGKLLFVGSIRGWFYALRLRENVTSFWGSVDAMLVAPPAAMPGRLYVADMNGGVHAYEVGFQDKLVWEYATRGPISAPFHVDARGCFVGSEDRRLYAFDLTGGQMLWPPVVCKGPLRDGVQAGANSLFPYARDDGLYAVDIVTGQVRWRLPEGRQVLAVAGDRVYVRDDQNHLRVIEEMTGKPVAVIPLTGYDLFASNATASAAYVATFDGRVACLRPLGAERLTAEQLRGETR